MSTGAAASTRQGVMGTSYITQVECTGNEDFLRDCPSQNFTAQQSCMLFLVAEVQCLVERPTGINLS